MAPQVIIRVHNLFHDGLMRLYASTEPEDKPILTVVLTIIVLFGPFISKYVIYKIVSFLFTAARFVSRHSSPTTTSTTPTIFEKEYWGRGKDEKFRKNPPNPVSYIVQKGPIGNPYQSSDRSTLPNNPANKFARHPTIETETPAGIQLNGTRNTVPLAKHRKVLRDLEELKSRYQRILDENARMNGDSDARYE